MSCSAETSWSDGRLEFKSFYFVLFISLTTANRNKENRYLHVGKKEEVRSDDHYHMILRERNICNELGTRFNIYKEKKVNNDTLKIDISISFSY